MKDRIDRMIDEEMTKSSLGRSLREGFKPRGCRRQIILFRIFSGF